MPRYVALFRGINVGKSKRIAMADLRALLAKLGYTCVQTLLNSGNAVFTGAAAPTGKHAARIRAAVAKQLGVDALVIVKSAKDIAAIVADDALARRAPDPTRLLVAVTHDAKGLKKVEAVGRTDWGNEQVHVGRHAAYLWCADGILESKAVAALLGRLAETGTTRNWATLGKIHALLQGADGR
jgi:uncharacterized protein (DUF1697 family)